jgi:hypothetical protein
VKTRRALTRMINGVFRVLCGLRGHTLVMNYDTDRLSLRCVKCDFQTIGWRLESHTVQPKRGEVGLPFAQRATHRPIGHAPR